MRRFRSSSGPIWAGLLCVLLAGCASGEHQLRSGDPSTADASGSLADQAEGLTAAGKFREAEGVWYRVLVRVEGDRPATYRALMGLAEVSLGQGNHAGALARYRDAEGFAGTPAQVTLARVGQARTALAMGDLTLASTLRGRIGDADAAVVREIDAALARSRPPAPAPRVHPPAGTGAAVLRRPAGHGIDPPRIASRESWGARPLRSASQVVAMGRITRLTIHHTAEGPGKNAGVGGAPRMRAYQSAHQNGNHWADIGYHFVIDTDGRIWEGRELVYQGAHAGNPAANRNNVGIALMGNFDIERPTPAQRRSLELIVTWIVDEYDVDPDRIYTHNAVRRLHDLGGTACPGKYLASMLVGLRADLRRHVALAE